MRVFVTVVDLGSQSAAADHLDLSRPVVSRYLAELEDWVGARFAASHHAQAEPHGRRRGNPATLPAIAGTVR